MERKLLHTPEGVRDIYNGEFQDRLYILDRIHSAFERYGYKDIKTPTFEFFDIFNKERGSVASNNMFKFFDKQGNTLVLRPDITPSIARCAAKYFEDNDCKLRLCYTGDTFINSTRYQGRLTENTQAGCEFIGDNSIASDAEMISLLVYSILRTGLKDFQVELGHIGFFKGLVMEAGLDDEEEAEMREIIRNKNIFRVSDLLDKDGVTKSVRDCFYGLPQLFGDVDVLERAKALANNETSLAAINHLESVYKLLKVYGFEKYVTFDLGMLSELDYYTGVIFKAYTYDVGEPIANGGRYDKLIGQFGKDKPSIGFSIIVDLLHQAISRQKLEIKSHKFRNLFIYDDEHYEDAIKLAQYYRNDTQLVELLSDKDSYDESNYNRVIKVDASMVSHYDLSNINDYDVIFNPNEE